MGGSGRFPPPIVTVKLRLTDKPLSIDIDLVFVGVSAKVLVSDGRGLGVGGGVGSTGFVTSRSPPNVFGKIEASIKGCTEDSFDKIMI